MKFLNQFLFFLLAGSLLTACNSGAEGEKVEAGDAVANVSVAGEGTRYAVDASASSINWTGSKPTGNHMGTLNITDGFLTATDNTITGGEFNLDMTSITVTDLEGEQKASLEGHLKTGDFFEVEKYPTGKFVIVSATPVSGKPGVTHEITGNLTMKGITKSVTIPAQVAMRGDVISAVAPDFKIDRTQWNVQYNSPGLASTAKDKIIYDEIGLNLELKAQQVAM